MLTHVEFRSNNFPPSPGEEDEINPGRWGKKLAEFIHTGLRSQGLNVSPPAPEDWGWRIEVPNEAFPIWIGCGNYEEYEDGFLCFIEPSKPFVRKLLFRKIPTETDVTRVQKALEELLSIEPTITEIRWRTLEEFMSPALPR